MPNTTLRPLTRDDTGVLHSAVFAGEDPDPHGYLFKGGRPETVEQVHEIVEWLMDGFEAGAALQPILLTDDSNQVVGLGWITEGEEGDAPEMSFIVGPMFRGQGHASTMAAQLAQIALGNGAGTVEAVVDIDNEPVVVLLEKLGFEVASAEHLTTHEVTWSKRADNVA